MVPEVNCPDCGAVIPDRQAKGLCPHCALSGLLKPEEESAQITHTVSIAPEAPTPAHPMVGGARRVGEGSAGKTFGDYELLEEIARGGMGVVFKARQKSLDRIVAVKMILAGEFASKEQALRFRVEAEAAARLQHPNIVRIHETGEWDGQPYFSMDYVESGNLARLVREKPLPAKRAAAYVKTIAEAIHYAHEQGILHRDLKPSNVLIDHADQPRVTDFGLAKRVTKESFLTVTGDVMGSPSFMPPEQAGAKGVKAGRYSDVYGLGAILFYLVTGRPPFVAGSVVETLDHVLNAEPVSPRLLNPSVPQDLATICLKCLEKDPVKRYQTAQALADELGRFLRDEPIHARPVGAPERFWRWCRRNPALAASFGVVLALLVTVLVGGPVALLRIRHAQQLNEEDLYVANVHQANEAVEAYDLHAARQVFQRIEASAPQRAMRGWEWRYLAHRLRSGELATLARHDAWFSSLAVAPDGRHFAAIAEDGTVMLWNLAFSPTPIAWSAHPALSRGLHDVVHHGVCFTPDGTTLITSGLDKTVRLWDVTTRELRGTLDGLPTDAPHLAVSRDGKLLAAMTGHDQTGLWKLDGTSATFLARLRTMEWVSSGVSFSPDGQSLLSGWVEKPILRYDLTNPETPQLMAPLAGTTPPFVFSPDGRMLITAGASGRIVRRWTWPELRPLPDLLVRGGSFRFGAFSPDGQSFAAGLGDGQINLWNVTNLTEVEPRVLHGHQQIILGIGFLRTNGVNLLASVSWDKAVRLWAVPDAKREAPLLNIGQPVLALAISPDGKRLATSARAVPSLEAEGSPFQFVVQLWDVKTRREIASVKYGKNRLKSGLAFSADGTLLGADDYGSLSFYAVPSLEKKRQFGQRSPVFAPDGRWFAYVSGANQIVKRTSLDEPKTVLLKTPNEISHLGLSPDGRTLASTDTTGPVELWDTATGWPLARLLGHELRVVAPCFSPDSRTLVTPSWDGQLGLWDVATGRNRAFLRAHRGVFLCAAFSPDGRTIATGGDDDTVRLWNLARQQEVLVLHSHTGSVNGVVFTPDGQWLISASDDGTVRFWPAPEAAEH